MPARRQEPAPRRGSGKLPSGADRFAGSSGALGLRAGAGGAGGGPAARLHTYTYTPPHTPLKIGGHPCLRDASDVTMRWFGPERPLVLRDMLLFEVFSPQAVRPAPAPRVAAVKKEEEEEEEEVGEAVGSTVAQTLACVALGASLRSAVELISKPRKAKETAETDLADPWDADRDVPLEVATAWRARQQSAPADSPLRDYAVVRVLGGGAASEVFLVRRRGELTVLKETPDTEAALREYRLLRRVDSPHVVRVLRCFEEQVAHRRLAYLELEYCAEGALLTVGGDFERLREVMHDVLAGVVALHAARVVHRDLKPDNVLLGDGGVAKVADLGVATQLSDAHPRTRAPCGTVAFMAPEVRRMLVTGREAEYDERADVWSLGALLFSLATGAERPDLHRRPLDEVAAQVADAPPWVARVLRAALPAAPEERATAEELLGMVEPGPCRL